MNIRDLFEQVDRTTNKTYPDIEDWAQELGVEIPCGTDNTVFESRVTGIELIYWLCTDTQVGLNLYFFDDRPLGLSWQTARKNSTDYEFVSKEIAEELRQFIFSIVGEQELPISMIDLEEDLGTSFTVHYGSQLQAQKGVWNGEWVKLLKTYDSYADIDKWSQLVVQKADGSEHTISTSEFKIPFVLKGQSDEEAAKRCVAEHGADGL